MKLTLLYSIIFSLLFLFACNSETEEEINEGFTLSLTNVPTQNAEERHILKTLEKTASINLSEFEIFIPELISVSPNGTIGVFDYSQMKMNLIEPEEDFLGSNHTILPITEGRGPGELLNPVSTLFVDDGELMIADPANAKLMYFTLEGDLIRELMLSERPHRMANTADHIIFAYIMGDHLFTALDDETMEKIGSFGEIDTTAPMLKQGNLSSRGDKVVFMPYGSSWFALFTDKGELRYQISTIEPITQTDNVLEQLRDSPTSRPEDFRFINSSVQLTDDMVVILHAGETIGNIGNTIDIYSATDGNYLGSYMLDAPANLIRLQGNTLYARSRNSDGDFLINVYDFQPQQLVALIGK